MSNQSTSKTVVVNGLRVAYTEAGKGDLTLIFIHGFPFNRSTWDQQVAALSSRCRVIAYDIRGFGESEAGSGKVSIDLYASDLLQFIDAVGTGKVVACGLSMGGYILMNAVCREPEKFAGVIFADTQCIADSAENREKRFKTIEKIEADGLTPFAEGYVQNVFCKKSLDEKKTTVEQVRKIITGTSKTVITETLKALADRKESCNNLKSLNMPALIICGKEDTVTPLSQSELLNNSVAGSHLEIIGDAGHMSNLEQPGKFNAAVEGFLKELS